MRAFTRAGIRASALALGLVLCFAAGQASATVMYGGHVGPNVTFSNVQETSAIGPEPLWDAPVYVGNQMLFFPSAFVAASSGGGIDTVSSQLQAQFSGTTALDTITQIDITEFGDATLSGVGGAATGASAAMSGFVTVLADTSGAIAPVVIPFTAAYTPAGSVVGGQLVLGLPGDAGVTIWSATTSVDIASVVPNATLVQLSLDNTLSAASEVDTSSLIQKKVVDGPAVIIDVIPEPGTALLVGSGLFIMSLRTRRQQGS